jgi:hypothetical protein
MNITESSTSQLRRKRGVLIKRFSQLDPAVIRGSLVERYKRCGKAGCKCMLGKGHGPKYYLTLCLGKGKLDSIYVPQEEADKVCGYVRNFHLAQEALKELCDINRELLRRREPF